MSPYFDCVEDLTIEDQLMDLFIDQLHQFAEVDEEESLAALDPGPVAQWNRATAF